MRLHWNGSGLLLHELCHLIHQFALPDGLDNEIVKKLYEEARNSGRYIHTLRRDWAGQEEDYDMGGFDQNTKHEFMLFAAIEKKGTDFLFLLLCLLLIVDNSLLHGGPQRVLRGNVSGVLERWLSFVGQRGQDDDGVVLSALAATIRNRSSVEPARNHR
jgi:hypothetical protein